MNRHHAYAATSLGELLLVAHGDDLVGIYFPDHRYPPRAESLGERVEPADVSVLEETARQLGEYLGGSRTHFDLPLKTAADEFSESVWQILRTLSFGQTTTYGAIATTLGNPHLAQRVGWPVGHNPLSIVVPCHRVVGANGSLTGFAGGLERKRALLELEGSVSMDRLF